MTFPSYWVGRLTIAAEENKRERVSKKELHYTTKDHQESTHEEKHTPETVRSDQGRRS
jgi:hypothetical protein